MSRHGSGVRVNDGGGTIVKGRALFNRLRVQDDTVSDEGYIQDLGVDTFEMGGQIVDDIDDDGTLAANSDSRLSTQKAVKTYVDTVAAAQDEFIELLDTPSGYTVANAIYTTNATPDAVIETTTQLTEPLANTMTFTRGTTILTSNATCTLNQNLSNISSPTFNILQSTVLRVGTTRATAAAITASTAGGVGIQMHYNDEATKFWNISVDSSGHLHFNGQSTSKQLGFGVDGFGQPINFFTTTAGKSSTFASTTGTFDVTPINATTDAIHINDGYLHLPAGAQVNELSIDGTMAGNSDLALPTEKAVVTYVLAQFPDAVNLFFVGKHGNDSSDGLTWRDAKLTIANAISAASAGDVIAVFDAGVYTENITITTDKKVYMPNATLTGSTILQNGSELNVAIVNNSTGTAFSLNVASSVAHVDAHEVYCTGTANMAVCNNGELNLHINHVEINTGDVVAETNSDRIFAEFGTIIVKGAGADVFACTTAAAICASIKCIREDGGTGTLFKGTPAGAAYMSVTACSVALTNLSDINAVTECHLNAASLAGALNENGAGTVIIGGGEWIAGVSSIGCATGADINEFSIDGTLAGNSDLAVPTEKAVKTYADAHASSDGSSHTFINQNVTSTGTPTFTSINIGDTTLSTYLVGTHSVTWTNIWAADQNKTIYYTIIGNVVTLRLEAFRPAVNAADTIVNTVGTYLPAALRPAAEIRIPIIVTDNSVSVYGAVEIETDGSIIIYVGANSAFQNAGDGGVKAASLTYLLT
jgi:hypothetical protein